MKNLKEIKKDFLSAIFDISTCAISGAVGTFANIDPRVEVYVAKKLKFIQSQFLLR